jgi:Trk-type K+ transport system membrane component
MSAHRRHDSLELWKHLALPLPSGEYQRRLSGALSPRGAQPATEPDGSPKQPPRALAAVDAPLSQLVLRIVLADDQPAEDWRALPAREREAPKVVVDAKPNWRRVLRARVMARLSQMTYYQLHLSAFVAVSVVTAHFIFAVENTGGRSLAYVDAVFTAVSAACVTGLISVDFSRLSPASQVACLLAFCLGSQLTWSLVPPLLQRAALIRYPRRVLKSLPPNLQLTTTSVRIPENVFDSELKLQVRYNAVCWIIRIISIYALSIYALSFVALGLYMQLSEAGRARSERNGVNPWWFALFHAASAFTNSGFSLYADNLMQFASDRFVPLLSSFLILAGNVAYPIFLYALVHVLWRRAARREPEGERAVIFRFLVEHPRECTVMLFPLKSTLWLLSICVGLIAVELAFFAGFDWNSTALETLSPATKLTVGWFQSVSTRTAGFNVVDLSQLHNTMLILYIGMMYLASFPIAISVRRTNSVLASPDAEQFTSAKYQASRLLQQDVFWLFGPWLLISIFEGASLNDSKTDFTPFRTLFEVASAIGTVGLSMGYPGKVTSFAGALSSPSKLVLCAVMLYGRHRGLPDSIDEALGASLE